MSILKAKKKKGPLPALFAKRLSNKVPGNAEKKEAYSALLEKARQAGLKHRVPPALVREFLESVRMIDEGESLEKVISRLKEKGIHDVRMFRILAERAEKRRGV